MTDSAMRELAEDPYSRKRFFKMAGGAGAVGAFGVLLAACGDDDEDTGDTGDTGSGDNAGDIEIVNYALTLEYLEAAFYKQAAESGQIKDKATLDLAKQFGDSEQQHVDALIATVKDLGGTPVESPKTAFEDVIAGGPEMILATAATVENLGAAAYLNEAPKIKNKDVLAAGLAIHSVEARHAAALNQLIGRGFGKKGGLEGSLPDGAFGKPMDMDAVLKAAAPFIAS